MGDHLTFHAKVLIMSYNESSTNQIHYEPSSPFILRLLINDMKGTKLTWPIDLCNFVKQRILFAVWEYYYLYGGCCAGSTIPIFNAGISASNIVHASLILSFSK